jgi:hypothetical protein
MDRKTKEILHKLDQMRRVDWEPGTKVMGMDVHTTIDILAGLTRNLCTGTVFLSREREKKRKRKLRTRLEARREMIQFRESIDRFITLVEEMNNLLRDISDGILVSLGYHRHDRGDWQLSCYSSVFLQFRDEVNAMKTTKTEQPIAHSPPEQDPEVLKLFARARKGDTDALKQVQDMIRDRKWATFLGDLGQDATLELLAHVAVGDPVWKLGLVEQVNDLTAELLGENPSVLEKLLVRRIINGWIAVHTLELEFTALKRDSLEKRGHLDKAISRAQKRYTEAIHELARVRRLQAPKVLSRAVRGGGSLEVRDLLIPMGRQGPATPANPSV